MGDDEPRSASWQSLLGMGTAVAALVAIGIVLGLLADKAFGTAPALMITGIALGVLAAIAFAVAKFRQYLKS